MCEQCFLVPLHFGEFLPGLYLGRARRDGQEGGKVRDWFLVRCNDPDIYWQETPRLEVSFENEEAYFNSVMAFMQQLEENGLDLLFAHKLVEAMISKGYSIKEDGNPYFMLYDMLAQYIVSTEPEIEDPNDDIFKEWEKEHPTDLTVGKE